MPSPEKHTKETLFNISAWRRRQTQLNFGWAGCVGGWKVCTKEAFFFFWGTGAHLWFRLLHSVRGVCLFDVCTVHRVALKVYKCIQVGLWMYCTCSVWVEAWAAFQLNKCPTALQKGLKKGNYKITFFKVKAGVWTKICSSDFMGL